MPTAEKIVGLTQRTTGLPFIIWVKRSGGKNTPTLEVTETQEYSEERTMYTISPLMRVFGSYSWTETSLIGLFLYHNREQVLSYWRGSFEDTKDFISKIVKADEAMVTQLREQGQQIFKWLEASELAYQTTGKIDQSYKGIRDLPPDHPEPD